MRNSKFMEKVALAALAASATFGIAQSAHADVTTKWSGAPETREDDRRFHVNGRFQFDVFGASADANTSLGASPGHPFDSFRSGTRRAFLGVDGRFSEHWRYNAKFDINPDGGGSVNADDFFLEYAGDSFSLYLGQNNAVSPLEDRTSSLNIPFNERSAIISASGYGKQVGVAWLTNGGNWSLGAGLFGDSLKTSDKVAGSESFEERVRFTIAPFFQETPEGTTLLHLGVSARHREDGSTGTTTPASGFSYSATPNYGFNPSSPGLRLAGPSSPFKGSSDDTYGAEAAFQWNAFGAEAEYMVIEPDFIGSTLSPSFSGGYVDLFWSPTGESRSYKASDGSFGSIKPRRPMGADNGIGHIMLSARYEWLNLTDSGVDGGESTSWVGGIGWVPIDHVKFQLNYSSNDIDLPSSTASGSYDAVSFRTQIDW